jgi:hypothetical protein
MLLNSWSLALSLTSFAVLFFMIISFKTAIKVIRYWDHAQDSHEQIKLENQIWLTSTLVKYGLGFQLLTLIIFIMAADSFSQVIIGAMCATGTLLANPYGLPVFFAKIAMVFLAGLWIAIHQLDISSEKYPLVKHKFIFLLILMPLIVVEIILQTKYLAGIKPDIITSCCAVVFDRDPQKAGTNLIARLPDFNILLYYYAAIIFLFIISIFQYFFCSKWLSWFTSLFWLLFFGLAALAITSKISSYIYAMPFHNCPFCILKPEYNYIGFFIYGGLISATFFGMLPGCLEPLKKHQDLRKQICIFQKNSIIIALISLIFLSLTSSWHLILFKISGGEF